MKVAACVLGFWAAVASADESRSAELFWMGRENKDIETEFKQDLWNFFASCDRSPRNNALRDEEIDCAYKKIARFDLNGDKFFIRDEIMNFIRQGLGHSWFVGAKADGVLDFDRNRDGRLSEAEVRELFLRAENPSEN